MNIGDALALGLGVYLFYRGEMSIGMIYTLVSLVSLLSEPVWQVRVQITNYQRITVSLTRILELFRMKSHIITGAKDLSIDVSLDVKIEALSFGYTDERNILDNINLYIPAGTCVWIVGKTGSGKTTLLKIISKLIQAD